MIGLLIFLMLAVLWIVAAAMRSIGRRGRRQRSHKPGMTDEELVSRLASIPGATVTKRGRDTIVNIGGSPPPEAPRSHLPEITWVKVFSPPEKCRIEYVDAKGVASERLVYMARRGRGTNGHDYIGVYDSGKFKTFRADRITEIEIAET